MKFANLDPDRVVETFQIELGHAENTGDFFITQFFPQDTEGDEHTDRFVLFVRSEFAATFHSTDELLVLNHDMWHSWGHGTCPHPNRESRGLSNLFDNTALMPHFRTKTFCMADMEDVVRDLKVLLEFKRDHRMVTYSQEDILGGLMESMNKEADSLDGVFPSQSK